MRTFWLLWLLGLVVINIAAVVVPITWYVLAPDLAPVWENVVLFYAMLGVTNLAFFLIRRPQ